MGGSIAEGDRRVVADPVPQRQGTPDGGTLDEVLGVQPLGRDLGCTAVSGRAAWGARHAGWLKPGEAGASTVRPCDGAGRPRTKGLIRWRHTAHLLTCVGKDVGGRAEG